MSTVLAAYTSQGRVGRCDARCHHGIAGECECIRGGRNHSDGHRQAVENTRQLRVERAEEAEQLNALGDFAERNGLDATALPLQFRAELPLFA